MSFKAGIISVLFANIFTETKFRTQNTIGFQFIIVGAWYKLGAQMWLPVFDVIFKFNNIFLEIFSKKFTYLADNIFKIYNPLSITL
jgi:hypothetical protein